MAMSKDLFLALLSMDAYNRGYGAGLTLPVDSPLIGNATVYKDSSEILRDPITDKPLDAPAGFYAVAYRTTQNIGSAETEGVIPVGTKRAAAQPSPGGRGSIRRIGVRGLRLSCQGAKRSVAANSAAA